MGYIWKKELTKHYFSSVKLTYLTAILPQAHIFKQK